MTQTAQWQKHILHGKSKGACIFWRHKAQSVDVLTISPLVESFGGSVVFRGFEDGTVDDNLKVAEKYWNHHDVS